MRWEDERYVRLFTRDTATWKRLPWQAKCLLPQILRKLDRAGIADVGEGDETVEGIAALTDMPTELVEAALPALLKHGVFTLAGGRLLMPNFMAAQEAKASDKLRAKEYRERARAKELPEPPEAIVTHRDGADTQRDAASRSVADRHAESHAVTRRHTPSLCAEPIRTSPPNPPTGGEGGEGEDDSPPRLPSAEPAGPPKLDWVAVEDALCRASRGTIDPSGGAQMRAKLLRLLGELGCSLADVDALGRFCAARPPTFPRWASHHRTLNLGHLLTEKLAEGSGLADLVSNARAWAKAEAAKPPTPSGPKGPRTVPGAARTEAEAAEGARLLAEGRRGPAARALVPATATAPFAKAVGQ